MKELRILFGYRMMALGGAEVVLRTRMKELLRRGIETMAIFLEQRGGESLFEDFGGRIVVCSHDDEIVRVFKEFGPSWIVMFDTSSIMKLAMKYTANARLLYEHHFPLPANRGILLDRELLIHVSGVVVPSASHGEYVQERLACAVPLRVVWNSLSEIFFEETDEAAEPVHRPVIAWVGRLDTLKNWQGFIELAKALKGQVSAEFWLIGGGQSPEEERAQFLQAVEAAELQDHLRWFPAIEHRDMPKLYRTVGQSGGCLVSTSWSESFGLVVLEAMASYCPVVVPYVTGIKDLVTHGQTGLFYAPGSIKQACTHVVELMKNTHLRRTIINRARPHAMTFTPARSVDQFLEALAFFENGLTPLYAR